MSQKSREYTEEKKKEKKSQTARKGQKTAATRLPPASHASYKNNRPN